MPQKVVKSKKVVVKTPKKVKKPVIVHESSEEEAEVEEQSSDEEMPVPVTKKGKQKKTKVEEPVEEDDSEDDDQEASDDDDEDEVDEDSEEKSDNEEESEEEEEESDDEQANSKKRKISEEIDIFVGNVDSDMKFDKIEKFFKKNGVAINDHNRQEDKNFFTITIDSSLKDKVLKMNEKVLKGDKLKVELIKKSEKLKKQKKEPKKTSNNEERSKPEDNCLLFVKNLPEDITNEQLNEKFPESVSCRVARGPGRAFKGFAFIEFESEEDVDSAMKIKQGMDINGYSIFLDYTGNKAKGGRARNIEDNTLPGKKLFVKNLSFNTSEDTLKELFENSVSVRIAKFPDTGKSRGFAFIEFENIDAAKSCLDNLNGTEVDGRSLDVAIATPNTSRGRGFERGRGGRGRGGSFRGRGGRGGDRGGFRGRGGSQSFRGSKKSF